MKNRLVRRYGSGHLHFIMCCCYRRLPFFGARRARDAFRQILSEVRKLTTRLRVNGDGVSDGLDSAIRSGVGSKERPTRRFTVLVLQPPLDQLPGGVVHRRNLLRKVTADSIYSRAILPS
jgi:hypothetical protein